MAWPRGSTITGPLGLALLATAILIGGVSSPPSPVPIVIDAGHAVATFKPNEAFGVAFDGGGSGESKPLLAADNREALAAVGVPRGTYRLRTELAIEAWHWSAFGRWSDPSHQQGYWTGDPDRDDPSPISFGYRLPRRGDTLDEADNDGFSRLDDGDAKTFWKSNPYLDGRYTHLPGERAEWVKIDLGAVLPIDAIEIDWAKPYARRYQVQRWVADNDWAGHWADFPTGRIEDGAGGAARTRLAQRPIDVRYVRIAMTESSHQAPTGASDPRDALGYAIGEIRLGRTGPRGELIDALSHAPDHLRQSLVYVSSTDPWHRAQDIDRETEQPSALAIVRSGLIGGGPMMIPVGVLYDTPENAVAELAYFQRRGLKLGQVELGEEPDGQRVLPEDYGALYVEFARALHRRRPDLVLGGPSLVGAFAENWLEEGPDRSFSSRFIAFLKRAGAEKELGFYSFEFYPFEDFCDPPGDKLVKTPKILESLFKRLRADGVAETTPLVISEYGLSAFVARLEVEPPSALFTAEVAAEFLSRGGTTANLYGFAPNRTMFEGRPCAGFGNMMLWEADAADRARWPMPAFYGWRMLTRDWAEPGAGVHTLFGVAGGRDDLGAYTVHRPDGRWSVLLVNRSDRPTRIALSFRGGGPDGAQPVERLTYGAAQYRWSVARQHPVVDLPPQSAVQRSWGEAVTLPPLSLTVLRSAGGR